MALYVFNLKFDILEEFLLTKSIERDFNCLGLARLEATRSPDHHHVASFLLLDFSSLFRSHGIDTL